MTKIISRVAWNSKLVAVHPCPWLRYSLELRVCGMLPANVAGRHLPYDIIFDALQNQGYGKVITLWPATNVETKQAKKNSISKFAYAEVVDEVTAAKA